MAEAEAAAEVAERNRQLKAALMDDPEVVAETPAAVQDGSAAVEEPVTPPSALQKQKRMIRKTMAAWRNAMVIR